MPNAKCDNCGKVFEEGDLKEIEHLSMRVGAGTKKDPSGECPECGSLCFPTSEEPKGGESDA